MNLKEYLSITPEISAAIRDGKPVVALESTILSHGMPYPDNLAFAAEVERIVRAEGAVPATMAIIDGVLKVGLTQDELELMCKGEGVAKVSRRDLPIMVAEKRTGATTVASTMILASLAGIRVFATAGIGGVHRGAEKTMDISADLQELRQTSVAVVCAGAKMILDIGLTLEYLETMGVPVLGLRTDDFPAFYCRRSGFGVDYNAKDEAEIARIAKTKWDLGLAGGILIGNPVPEEYAMDFDEMTAVIEKAIAGANAEGVARVEEHHLLCHGAHREYTGGQSLKTNIQLAYNNARAAGKIAVAYAKLGGGAVLRRLKIKKTRGSAMDTCKNRGQAAGNLTRACPACRAVENAKARTRREEKAGHARRSAHEPHHAQNAHRRLRARRGLHRPVRHGHSDV